MDTYAVWAQQKPNSLAVVEDSGRQLTWAQLVSDRNRLVDGLLRKLKLHREERVVIYAHNCLEYLVCNAAISIAGLLSIPMNWRLNEEEVIYICNNVSLHKFQLVHLSINLLPIFPSSEFS
jgi:acyl-CoA synthetase (AMP-forming)/AMP-acid ligase II